jgi:NAD(P)-dependent dehydrogenase (short-subunit alcohol dehydrogenase family)
VSSRRALVTGGTRGIGEAIARRLMRDVDEVIVTGTSSASVAPDGARLMVVDFADEAATRAFAAEVDALEVDVLVNNAGVNVIAPFAEIAVADFERIQRINLHAPFLLCRAVLRHMKSRGWGRIVNLSSIFGVITKAQRGSYSASKFALDGLTAALAVEVASAGILANCVAPGFVDTELTRRVVGEAALTQLAASTPIGRLARAGEIAELVAWLASPENSYLTGQNLVIDGGFSRV